MASNEAAEGQEQHPRPLAEKTKRKGPTLSTSTSSFEALDPHDPQLNHLASLMFSKTSDWITGELEATVDDYKLIEQMNRYCCYYCWF